MTLETWMQLIHSMLGTFVGLVQIGLTTKCGASASTPDGPEQHSVLVLPHGCTMQ